MSETLNASQEIYDPFYSEKNQTELAKRIASLEKGKAKMVVKTMKELEDMANKEK